MFVLVVKFWQQISCVEHSNVSCVVQRIKANQIHKLMREEKAVLEEQIQTLHTQVEAQLVVLRKLEEKEQLLQNNLATVEKELRSVTRRSRRSWSC